MGERLYHELSIDVVLENFRVSAFHHKLLFLCGLSFMADAMEVALLSYLSTCAGEEFGLSDSQVAAVIGVVFAGELFGSLFWGPFADWYGRRSSFLLSSFIIAVAGILSGFSPNYEWLLLFRGIVGFGIGGAAVAFDILAEFLPSSSRGKFLINIEYFWTIGSVLVTVAAWALLTKKGWRVLTWITSIPVAIAFGVAVVHLPESPRWLLAQGRKEEARMILYDAAIRSGIPIKSFQLSSQLSKGQVEADDGNFFLFLSRSKKSLLQSCQLWFVWASSAFCYYGLVLFVSRLYNTSSNDDQGYSCSFDYSSMIWSAVSELIGVTLSSRLIDSIGRVSTQTLFYNIAALSLCFVAIFNVYSDDGGLMGWLVALTGFVARAAMMAATSSTWVHTSELYPTTVRATGHSFCTTLAKVGGGLSPYLIYSNASANTVGAILGVLSSLTAFAVHFLPDTKGTLLDEPFELPQQDRQMVPTPACSNSYQQEFDGLMDGDDNETETEYI